jgi:hypothetical protein
MTETEAAFNPPYQRNQTACINLGCVLPLPLGTHLALHVSRSCLCHSGGGRSPHFVRGGSSADLFLLIVA